MQPCPCKAREAHWQVLEAAHILDEKIEWLSQLATRIGSTSHQHSHSHEHLRRWSRGHPRGHTKTPQVGIILGSHWQFPAKRIKGEYASHLPALPSQEDGSPSRSSKAGLHLRKTLWGSIWGRHPVEVNQWSAIWGPHLPWSLSWSLSWGCKTHARCRMGVVAHHQSPLWKIKRCGWSGKPTMLTCQSGGRN